MYKLITKTIAELTNGLVIWMMGRYFAKIKIATDIVKDLRNERTEDNFKLFTKFTI